MYYYKLFNLFTASEFPIPCADEIEKPSQIQVNVLFGEMDIDFKDREATFQKLLYLCPKANMINSYCTPLPLAVRLAGFAFNVDFCLYTVQL